MILSTYYCVTNSDNLFFISTELFPLFFLFEKENFQVSYCSHLLVGHLLLQVRNWSLGSLINKALGLSGQGTHKLGSLNNFTGIQQHFLLNGTDQTRIKYRIEQKRREHISKGIIVPQKFYFSYICMWVLNLELKFIFKYGA